MSSAYLSERRRLRKNFLQRTKYGVGYRATRRVFAPLVAQGWIRCARGAACRFAEWLDGELVGGLIEPGTPWDLGHDDYHSHLIAGPEHAACNRGAPNRNKTSRVW